MAVVSTNTSPCYTTEEIRMHYFPLGSGSCSGTNDSADNDEFPHQHREPKRISRARTLHASALRPGQLSHVLLFHGANPRWETSGIIYVKSGLQLLSRASSILAPANNTPIAIFSQQTATSRGPPPLLRFRFLGYYTIADVRVLQPDTDAAELKALLVAKQEEAALAFAASTNANPFADAVWVATED
ncbi:hypothetical protein DV736_g4620, partial [Chaetothyriales sp. CBS 134916]